MLKNLWEGDYYLDHFEFGQSTRLDAEQRDLLGNGSYTNLFRIPHFTAIMNAGRKMSGEKLDDALKMWADSITCLADIISIYISKSRLGDF
jgi:hypothetical protein